MRRFAQCLEQNQPQEAGVVEKITAPQTPRLGQQAKEPLQPALLHPPWRLPFHTGVKVKGGSYADQHRRA